MTLSLKGLMTFVAVLPFTVAVPPFIRGDVSSIEGKSYDYVIVGGGLTGLVVAHRLSENRFREFITLPGSLVNRLKKGHRFRTCP